MSARTKSIVMLAAVVAASIGCGAGTPQPGSQPAPQPLTDATTHATRVVMFGSGTPRPDPERSGPAVGIVSGDQLYLVDSGPGVVRRVAAAHDRGIPGVGVEKLVTAFITHLHSDHTVGLPDLIFTTWVQGRKQPLRLYGPPGLEAMVGHILAAWQADIQIRGKGPEHRTPEDPAVEAHDVAAGLVFQDANVKVSAFPAVHGEWTAYGYRIEARDRTIVISGDTSPGPALVDACQSCDVLIHEAYSEEYKPRDMPNWPTYRSQHHTTTTQLAQVALRTKPRLLVVYHRGVGPHDHQISDEQYVAEINRAGYTGKIVIARDFDVY